MYINKTSNNSLNVIYTLEFQIDRVVGMARDLKLSQESNGYGKGLDLTGWVDNFSTYQ